MVTSTFQFSFKVPTEVVFGAGCRAQVAERVDQAGWNTLAVVVDRGLQGSDAAKAFVRSLERPSRTVRVVWCDQGEPTYAMLDATRRQLDGLAADAVIGVGGGSALDTAKAMAVFVHNHEPAVRYRGFNQMTAPVVPIVAVPTTAGTGSEVTPNASFVDTNEQRKLGINGEAVRPRVAFLDPELTLSCPPRATLSAALDSMVHATEAFVARKSNPVARLFAREGLAKVYAHLPRVMTSPASLADRSEVMWGAFLAGVALMHSGTGPAAALSYPAGVHHGVPHGIGGAMFLPHVVRHNVRAGAVGYAGLYAGLPGADLRLSPAEQAAAFADRLFDLWATLEVPALSSFGVTAAHTDRIVTDTLQLAGALEQNPTPFGEAEIRRVLAAVL